MAMNQLIKRLTGSFLLYDLLQKIGHFHIPRRQSRGLGNNRCGLLVVTDGFFRAGAEPTAQKCPLLWGKSTMAATASWAPNVMNEGDRGSLCH